MLNKGKFLRFGSWLGLLLFLGAVFIFIPLRAQTRTQAETKPPEKKEQKRPRDRKQVETRAPEKREQAKPRDRKQAETKPPKKKEQARPPDRKQVVTKPPEKKEQAKVQAPTGANVEEIIKISKLTKEIQKFTIKRNIFSPDIIKPNAPAPQLPSREMLQREKEIENKIEQEKKNVLQEEIENNFSYEGYVVKDSKNIALVSLNGEFYAVGEGDMVDEKITIIIIEKETITIEFDNNILEIQLKGDEQK